jgi:hypothetical protein
MASQKIEIENIVSNVAGVVPIFRSVLESRRYSINDPNAAIKYNAIKNNPNDRIVE